MKKNLNTGLTKSYHTHMKSLLIIHNSSFMHTKNLTRANNPSFFNANYLSSIINKTRLLKTQNAYKYFIYFRSEKAQELQYTKTSYSPNTIV